MDRGSGWVPARKGGAVMDPTRPLVLAGARYASCHDAVHDYQIVWGARHGGAFDRMSIAVLAKDALGDLILRGTSTASWAGMPGSGTRAWPRTRRSSAPRRGDPSRRLRVAPLIGVGPDRRRAWLAMEIRRHQMPRWHEPAAGVHAVTPGGYSASRRDYHGRRVVSPVIAGLQAGPGRAVRPWHGWLGCHCNGGRREEAIGR